MGWDRDYGSIADDTLATMNRFKIDQFARFAVSALIIAAGAWVYWGIKPLNYASEANTLAQPDAAYDAILRGTIETFGQSPELAASERPTEKLRSSIRKLPSRDAILYLSSPQNPGDLAVRLVIGALSWPRPLFTPSCSQPGTGDLPPDDLKVGAAVYYHASPPITGTTRTQVLPELTITQSPEKYEWKFYCPR